MYVHRLLSTNAKTNHGEETYYNEKQIASKGKTRSVFSISMDSMLS